MDRPKGQKGTCSSCGCTWENACVNPIYGPCWWIDDIETICSHCHYGYEDIARRSHEMNLLGTAYHLENYLTSNDISQHQLARDLLVSQAHISLILSKQVFISERLAVKLEKLTGLSARKLLIEDMEYKLHLLEEEKQND